ncbi:hypothetical protein V1525DRAFT_416114 [Lipomyces kononenkoae]|uniref:Uncharacterized protein n=1 Tax=Lipomyces kononenkoae TaxID=34357 RepID=A0ACC3TAR8_LIPKO
MDNLTVGSPLAEAIQASIGHRLQNEGFAEDETPFISEFITVMMCNNKGPEQIHNELGELLGPDRFSNDFTTWLFQELKRLSDPESQTEDQNNFAPSQADSNMNSNAHIGDNLSQDQSEMQIDQEVKIPTGPSNDRQSRNRLFNNMKNAMQQRADGQLRRPRGQYSIGKQNNMSHRFGHFQQSNGHGRQNGFSYRGRGMNTGFGDITGFISNNVNNGYRHNNGYGQHVNANERGDEVHVELTPRNRCRHWPYHMAPCKFPHPLQICERYPNCPNERGTCAKIHVDEDMSADDATKYVASGGFYQFTPLFEMGTEWSRNHMNDIMMKTMQQHQYAMQNLNAFQNGGNSMQSAFSQYTVPTSAVPRQLQNINQAKGSSNTSNSWTKPSSSQHNANEQTPLCKFGLKCTNAECAFAHPTPANGSALILRNERCADGIACTDENCDKSHPSPASMRAAEEVTMTNAPASGTASEESGRSLEACRFYPYCTNPHCKFRHPKSAVLCRNGAQCTRLDCIFTHPLSIPCRFDRSCTNPDCLYAHPNGKGEKIANKVWIAPGLASKNEDEHVSERKFAVDDDSVAEHLVAAQSNTLAASQ